MEIARIVALADNGHTAFFPGPRTRRYNRVDIRLVPFGEDFYVLRATDATADLLGARLVSIDGHDMTQLRALARTLMGGTSARRSRALNATVLSLSLLTAFVAAEGYFSLFVDVTDSSMSLLTSARWAKRHYPPPQVFRGRKPWDPDAAGDGGVSIAVVGDSITFGQGIRLVLLGTTGGVSWFAGSDRASSSSALVVDGEIYLVDLGQGSTNRLAQAFNEDTGGAQSTFLGKVRALFLTHLHQDHTADYPNLLLIGPGAGLGSRKDALTGKPVPLKVYGPCNLGQVDEPVNIRALKRFVTDKVYANPRQPVESIQIKYPDQRVAIIGAGPCGLTAAQDVIRAGFPVTIFEAMPVAGGMLRLGVPESMRRGNPMWSPKHEGKYHAQNI